MPTPLAPWDLANAVTSFSTIGAGATTLILTALVKRQPARWWLVYANVLLTGIPTLGWHGWLMEPWRVADVASNLLLAWFLQLAVLGDFHGRTTRLRVGLLSGAINLVAISGLVREGLTGVKVLAIDFGEYGGFYPGEAMLIADSWLVVALFFLNRRRIPEAARPLLHVVTATFLFGLALATASGSFVTGRVLSFHALWHIVGGFGFILLWAFNHVRMEAGGLPPNGLAAIQEAST